MQRAKGELPKLVTPWAVEDAGRNGSAESATVSNWSGRTVPTPWPAAYGGDLCVGALGAIMRTVDSEQQAHSLQVAFLRPGDRNGRVDYAVEHVRDGFRYANRAVRVTQNEQLIAIGSASLRSVAANEPRLEPDNSSVMLNGMPCPESLPTAAEAIEQRTDTSNLPEETGGLDAYWGSGRAVDTRHIDPHLYGASVVTRAHNRLWVRFTLSDLRQQQLLDSRAGRSALLAYLADDTILEPALASLGIAWRTPGLFSTTVQQSLWFHADFDPADWLYFDQKLLSFQGDHAVCEGSIRASDGRLVATVLQEGIVKRRSLTTTRP